MFGVSQEQRPSNPPSTTTSTAEEEALKRNTDCVYFLASPLTCKKGSECEYRHSDVARVNPRDCWYWLNGNCLNPKCAFRHPPLDGLLETQVPTPLGNLLPPSQVILEPSAPAPYVPGKQAVPCIYFQRGNCLKGDVCPFMHGLYPANNKVAQFATAAPVVESQPKKTFGGLGMFSQEQKVSQFNAPKPVNLPLHPKQVTPIENDQLRNGVVMKKNVPLSTTLEKEIARHRPTNVRSASNENPGSRLNRNHQIHVPDDQSILNSKDTEVFSREPSPGFDVLVDDKRRDSEYYPREDQFRRSIGHDGRNMNPINDYEIGRSDYNSEVDQVMYHESLGYGSYGLYGREECRISSERVSAHPERRRYPRTDNSDRMDEVDLRHHLSKQKRSNGIRSVVTHDHSCGSHVKDQTYRASRRDHFPAQESSLSSRLQGRIKVPGGSTSPVRHRGRLSPESPQGRLRDRIKGREQEDINNEKNFRGPGIRDIDDNNAEFTGPKRLAELRDVKKSDGYDQPMSERLSLGKRKFPKLEGAQQVDGDMSFKGPMPLSEILKRKRGGEVAGNESGMTSANNGHDGNESSMMPIENKETKGAFSSVSSGVVNHVDKDEFKLSVSDGGADEKSTEGHSFLQLEAEEGMIGDEAIEDRDVEGYNKREGEYDYEQADGEDYNLDEGENVDLEDEYYEEEDADDFAKKMGVLYS